METLIRAKANIDGCNVNELNDKASIFVVLICQLYAPENLTHIYSIDCASQGELPIFFAERNSCTETIKALIQAKANTDGHNQKAMHFRGLLVLCPLSTLYEFSSTLCRLEVQGVDTCAH